MKNNGIRAIFIGFVLFIGLTIPKIISKESLTFESFIPAIAGGIVAGLVIYLGQIFFKKK